MASEGGENGGLTGYIDHHLHHLANGEQHGLLDFSVVHWDTLFFSLLCAAIVLVVLRLAARKATSGVPGKFQAAVEMLVEMVNEQANALVKGNTNYIAPLALIAERLAEEAIRARTEKHEIATAEAEVAALNEQLKAIAKLRPGRR